MAFKVIWSPQATEDLYAVTATIAQTNAYVAEQVGLTILSKCRQLFEYPLSGRIVPERDDPKIRELIHRPYRIVYRVNRGARTAEIMRVWHAARGEPDLPS